MGGVLVCFVFSFAVATSSPVCCLHSYRVSSSSSFVLLLLLLLLFIIYYFLSVVSSFVTLFSNASPRSATRSPYPFPVLSFSLSVLVYVECGMGVEKVF